MSWPRVGGGVRIAAGVAASSNGIPTWRITPQAGWSCSTVMPERDGLRRRERRDDVVDRPGTGSRPRRGPPASRPVVRAGEERGEDRAQLGSVARPGRRWSRSADRSASSGRPSAAQSRGHCRSDPTATAIAPSAVSNVSYGTMFGWALPSRPGAAPVTNAFCAWLTRLARVAPRSETSTRWPRPAAGPASRSRPTSAAEDPDRPEHPGHDVADRDPDLGRLAAVGVGGAGDRHQAARRLDRRSRSRAGRPPGRSCRSRRSPGGRGPG